MCLYIFKLSLKLDLIKDAYLLITFYISSIVACCLVELDKEILQIQSYKRVKHFNCILR